MPAWEFVAWPYLGNGLLFPIRLLLHGYWVVSRNEAPFPVFCDPIDFGTLFCLDDGGDCVSDDDFSMLEEGEAIVPGVAVSLFLKSFI